MPNLELQAAVDEMQATTNSATTIIDSAIAFVEGAAGVISTLREQLEATGATPEHIALIREAETALEQKKDALAAALTANTGTGPGSGPTG